MCVYVYLCDKSILIYNLHTKQFTHLKYTVDFSIFTKLCDHHHNQFETVFTATKRNPKPVISHSSFPPNSSLS